MFKFKIKHKYADIEKLMDEMIENPFVLINDPGKARLLGQIAKPLRDENILHISPDKRLNETVAFLKVNNVSSEKVKKKKGRNIEYHFENLLIPPNLY